MATAERKDIEGKVLQATLELVAEHGFHGTSVQMIAKRADVGVGSIYRYFNGKDELIHAVFNRIEEGLQVALLAGYSEVLRIEDRFAHLCLNLTIHFKKNPVVLRFIEQYFASPYGVANGKKMLVGSSSECVDSSSIFKSLFEEGRACGSIQDLPLMTLYALTLGALFFLVNGHNAGIFGLDEITIKKTIHTSWDAIKIGPPC